MSILNSGKQSGQVLIEAVVAMGIALVSLVALISLANKSVGNSGQSSRQAIATGYATEAMQWLKNEKVKGWKEFMGSLGQLCSGFPTSTTTCTNVCLNNISWTTPCPGTNISGTEYVRRLDYSIDASGKLSLTVKVEWYEEGRLTSAKQSSVLLER